MAQPLITTKISPEGLRLLRLVAAMTAETYAQVMERLLRAEAKRLRLPLSAAKKGGA